MANPILQALNGMRRTQSQNNIGGLLNFLRSGNPDAIYQQMINTNPKFRQFINDNKGKSAEQIAQENGIDLSILNQFVK